MIRHHISQLKGMNTDTEHLEGQSINQPSQNKEDAVRFNIVTSFSHSYSNDNKNCNGWTNTNQKISCRDTWDNTNIEKNSLGTFTEDSQETEGKHGYKTSSGCHCFHLMVHKVIPLFDWRLAVEPDTDKNHHRNCKDTNATFNNFTVSPWGHSWKDNL